MWSIAILAQVPSDDLQEGVFPVRRRSGVAEHAILWRLETARLVQQQSPNRLRGTPVFIEFRDSENPYKNKKNVLTRRQLDKRKRLKKFTRRRSRK